MNIRIEVLEPLHLSVKDGILLLSSTKLLINLELVMVAVHYEKGDIFEAKTQVIVNTVNCKGVMGKGLALAFKQRYPDMFVVYQQECRTGKLRIGRPTLYKASNPWILNFPTKDNWKANSKIEYLEKGLEYFIANYKKAGITSIAFPKLGAQNGRLSWDEVGPLMAKYLSQLDIDVYIYIADGDREYYHEDGKTPVDTTIIWQQFNELALSLERLQQGIALSSREAKKILEKRATIEITSLADIDNIEGLAKISRKRISDYIHQQMCGKLFPVENTTTLQPAKEKIARKSSKRKTSRKKSAKDSPMAESFMQQSFPEPEAIASSSL